MASIATSTARRRRRATSSSCPRLRPCPVQVLLRRGDRGVVSLVAQRLLYPALGAEPPLLAHAWHGPRARLEPAADAPPRLALGVGAAHGGAARRRVVVPSVSHAPHLGSPSLLRDRSVTPTAWWALRCSHGTSGAPRARGRRCAASAIHSLGGFASWSPRPPCGTCYSAPKICSSLPSIVAILPFWGAQG